jgi:putative hydrolase of the HAD superfamily
MRVDFEPRDASAVVFDAVGTLIEAVPSVAEAYAGVAQRQGLATDVRAIETLFRRHFRADEAVEQLESLATDEPRERARWRRIVANVLPDLPDLERGFQELWEHFGRPSSWRVYADVGATLIALERAGVAIRIASNFDARLRQVVLGLPPLARFSESLVISSEIGVRKPHPAFYAATCASLDLPPERVLWVGDDPENDVRGPRRAGSSSLLLNRNALAHPDLPSLPRLDLLTAGTSADGFRA